MKQLIAVCLIVLWGGLAGFAQDVPPDHVVDEEDVPRGYRITHVPLPAPHA